MRIQNIHQVIKEQPQHVSKTMRKLFIKLFRQKKKFVTEVEIRRFSKDCRYEKVFIREDTTNLSHKLCTYAEDFYDTKPIYHTKNLPEKRSEVFLRKTVLTMDEKEVMKKQKLGKI